MKLCQKCYDAIKEAGYGIVVQEAGFVSANPFLVFETDCEFWAHKELNDHDCEATLAMEE